jgi:hypothetical protein
MEMEEYVRIFLENNPSWNQCLSCSGLHKKSNFRWCVYCDKNMCMNCHRTHEIQVGHICMSEDLED